MKEYKVTINNTQVTIEDHVDPRIWHFFDKKTRELDFPAVDRSHFFANLYGMFSKQTESFKKIPFLRIVLRTHDFFEKAIPILNISDRHEASLAFDKSPFTIGLGAADSADSDYKINLYIDSFLIYEHLGYTSSALGSLLEVMIHETTHLLQYFHVSKAKRDRCEGKIKKAIDKMHEANKMSEIVKESFYYECLLFHSYEEEILLKGFAHM